MPRGKVQDTKHQEEKSHAKTQRRKVKTRLGMAATDVAKAMSVKKEHKEREKERQR
jgi:hypothetical protein